jgi:hypothetical protein
MRTSPLLVVLAWKCLTIKKQVPTQTSSSSSTRRTSSRSTSQCSASQNALMPKDPESPVTPPSRVVSRVRIPVTVVFDVLRALNENMTSTRTRSARYRVWNHGIRETPR